MKKNILLVDDSALMRRVLSDIINSDERFQVSKMAMNGLEAFDIIVSDYRKLDAIILDINMPKMNGLEFLEQLVKHNIKTTVIVVSTVAKEGAKETIRALELGAFDFVTKPDSFIDAKSESFRSRIIECLSIATKVYRQESITNAFKPRVTTASRPIFPKSTITSSLVSEKKIVALACSTGGPKSLQSVIPLLPGNLNAAMLIVQHMPAGFTQSLAIRLNEMSQLKVKEAKDGELIIKGTVYVAQGGKQMRVKKFGNGECKIAITDEAPRNALKPCADIMYESLAEASYDSVVCVILTGMGADGTKGIIKLNEQKNTYVIAQDEESSIVYGMPRVIAQAGLTQEILPLNKIASAITKNVGVR